MVPPALMLRKRSSHHRHSSQLDEPILKFIDKYLTAHSIKQMDFVVSKYVDQVHRCVPLFTPSI